MASFFKRLKRRIRDNARAVRLAKLNQVSEVTPQQPRVEQAPSPLNSKMTQVATLAAMLGHAPLRGVKGEKRG